MPVYCCVIHILSINYFLEKVIGSFCLSEDRVLPNADNLRKDELENEVTIREGVVTQLLKVSDLRKYLRESAGTEIHMFALYSMEPLGAFSASPLF
ncbi:hypothetical protein L798_04627 [Zootermopsis nevadensis]|uniref:Uncharacterized protein n=1 Tax=Zootermopsis nevadensis TaxID=136037 RepID=A0A067RUL9_ZOONE|nr:hypothetical protein L798_04627 [Zootermopsis nevadensis]